MKKKIVQRKAYGRKRIAVVALGGNAIIGEAERGDIHQQFANTRRSLNGVLELIKSGWEVVITHGNGPQVGNALIRVERAIDAVPPQPLGVIVADTQGSIGYMIEQSLQNCLGRERIKRDVATVLAQVIVERDDLFFSHPTKPVGPFYTKKKAHGLIENAGWTMVEDAGRGWRRVVPSPIPISIVEQNTITKLLKSGTIVITCGGGGIPVYREKDGTLEGVDAVIDKDRASAVLAKEIKAQFLIILTGVPQVALNFKKPGERFVKSMTVEEARTHLDAGQFPPGSMGPKIEAAIDFIEGGGRKVLITRTDLLSAAISGKTGTLIVK